MEPPTLQEIDNEVMELLSNKDDAVLLSWKEQAKNNSERHQLLLAKYYFKLSETCNEENNKYAEQSVEWLVKASRQGNEHATHLLSECCEKNIGVTDDNKGDVHWCLQTPEYEKQARLAAQKLFRSLSWDPSSQESQASITKEGFCKALKEGQFDKREKKIIEKAGKLKKAVEEVNEEEFVDKLIKTLHGYGGTLGSLLQKDVEWEAYTKATYVQKIIKYPGKTLSWLADNAIEVTGKQGMSWLRSLVPTNQIYMLMVFFLYSLMSAQVVCWFLPLLVFYASLITMVVCTLQMFYTKRKAGDIRVLVEMLNKFNSTLSKDTAESAYSWTSLTPYVVFFVALLFTVFSFLMADRLWIPCSELCFVAGFFTVGCSFALSDRYDHLAVLSMLLDSVSTLPAILEGFPRIPVLYQFLSFVLGPGFSIELLPDMYFQIGVPSLAYLVVPLLFLKMARQHSWQGTHRILVPHLVCFFWWRLAMMFFRYSSWIGMFRATVGWVSFVILLPFFLFFIIVWAAIYLSNILTFSNMLKVVTTISLLAIPASFAFWAKKGFKIHGFSPDLDSSRVKALLALVFVLSILPLTFLFSPPERDVHGHYVSWEQYRRLCSKPHWDQSNMADAMITCSHLGGMMVHWTGHVKKIVVKSTDNQAESFINVLPWALGNWLRCTYGEEYPDCTNITDSFDRELCEINKLQGRECHLKNLDRYMFEMWVKMPLDDGENGVHDVRVEANHWFHDVLMKIKQDDEVEFRASLQKELGNTWPILRLYHVSCATCPGEDVQFGTKGLTSRLIETYGIMLHIKRAFQGMWNFFLAPVVEFYYGAND